jgi:glycosyltransferase involved in cell wall biosynthesis
MSRVITMRLHRARDTRWRAARRTIMKPTPSPEVTILLPVHNGEGYLGQALDSVCAQSFGDFECIVIDDGSTDGTAMVVERHRRQDARVRSVRRAHGGAIAALNAGIELATGRYVARMDADDVSLPDRLATQVAFMNAHPDVGICGTWAKPLGGGFRDVWRVPTDDATLRCQTLFRSPFAHPTVMLRGEFVAQERLRYDPEYEHAEDYELWARHLGTSRWRWANIPKPLVHVRLHGEQVSHRFHRAQSVQSRRIRAMQLTRLGFDPTAAELDLHEAIVAADPPGTTEFLNAAHLWLQRLRTANDIRRCYPPEAFARELGDRWYRICSACVSLRPSVCIAYRRSPLARDNPSWMLPALVAKTARLDRRDTVTALWHVVKPFTRR